jgi:hypothetical protein
LAEILLEELMNRVASYLIAIAMICAPWNSVFSRGTSTLGEEDVDLRAQYPEVYELEMTLLIAATLTKSKDLAKKGRNTYFCEYDPRRGPKPCDRMDTVSGQYEDYYQSQMVCKERCPLENVSQSSWMYMMGETRICKDLTTGSCTKAALTVDQMREELIELIRLEAVMKR